MFEMDTQTKLRFARALQRGVLLCRRLAGLRDPLVRCRRGGLEWTLDLNEGIDLSIFLFGAFERNTSRAIARHLRPGMIAFDIGANIGAHALPMARDVGSSGSVFAIEPTNWAMQRLQANRQLNPGLTTALKPIHALLGDGSAAPSAGFYSSWNLGEVEDKHPVHGGVLQSIEGAENLTLDGLVQRLGISRLDLIKIDVDGWECKVFRGGAETLQRYKPTLVMELSPYVLEEHGGTFTELLALLKASSYSLYRESDESPLPDDEAKLRALIPRGGGINAVAHARS